MSDIDTMNKFGVAMRGNGSLQMMMPPRAEISPDDALVLAAYLVLMAERSASNLFKDVLAAVENS